MTPDIGRGRPCERRTREDGWTERSPSSLLRKEIWIASKLTDCFTELVRRGLCALDYEAENVGEALMEGRPDHHLNARM